MEEDFVPSSSIDSHYMPMDARMPLIEPSPNSEATNNNNNTRQLVVINTNNRDPSTTIGNSSEKYNQSSNQGVARSISTDTRDLPLKAKLFRTSQIKVLAFYQALFSEFIGTLILTLVCTSAGLPITSKAVPDIHGAFASGFVVATIVVGFGHASGAHINPAVTISFLVSLEVDVIRAVCYIVVQLLGAICGSSLLSALAPLEAQGNLGMTMVTEGISIRQALIVEFIITFILCFIVHAICDKRRDDIGGSKALAVGLAVIVGCFFGGPYTGGSMNPARSFGPATVMNSWKNHWIYWVGPLSGSIIAAIVYKRVLRKATPVIPRGRSRSRAHANKPNHV